MQLILVDRRLARARTMNLSHATIAWSALLLLSLITVLVLSLYVVTFRLAAQRDMPLVKQLVSAVMRDRLAQDEQYLRDNVSSMAKMVGLAVLFAAAFLIVHPPLPIVVGLELALMAFLAGREVGQPGGLEVELDVVA